MALELVGSRILAPYIGTSILVWTSLIGTIMSCLSLGYFWGGKLADKNPSASKLSAILFIGGFFAGLIPLLDKIFGPVIYQAYFIQPELGAIIGAVILFAIPNVLLGMVSPYCVRIKIHNLESSGSEVGSLYAVSTLGSIVGTFAGGFFLISHLGSQETVWIISAVLIFLSAILYLSDKSRKKLSTASLVGIIFCIFVLSSGTFALANSKGNFLADVDTDYSRVWVFDGSYGPWKRPARFMTNSLDSIQSGMYLDNPNELIFEYLKMYDLYKIEKPEIKNALAVGGSAYSYPKYFLKENPKSSLDVVEIDPKVTELAKKYFGLKDDPRLEIFHEDARTYLNTNKKKYDAVFMDAFLSYLAIPYQLTTEESVQKIYDSLNQDGVLATNIISSVTGKKSGFFEAEYATYKKVFPFVYAFKAEPDRPDGDIQNIMLLAVKSDKEPSLKTSDPVLKNFLSRKIEPPKNGEPILTDNFAPVEKYVSKFFR